MKPTLKSPCVRNCCLNKEDIYLGCFRSLEEICQWTLVDEKIRQQFKNNAEQRQQLFLLTH